MAISGNGSAARGPAPRFRIDSHPGSQAGSDPLGPGHSGRRFVTWAVLAILLIWGVLYLCFASWRAGYRERVAYARVALAPVVDPLALIVPPNVPRATWAEAVSETHAMLDRVAGAGVLDQGQVETLRAEMRARVRRATPQTAVRELIEIWVDMDSKAAPIIGARYPALFKFTMVVNLLMYKNPPDVDPWAWREALAETRLMLLNVTVSGVLSGAEQDDLADRISSDLSKVRPGAALDALALIWDGMADKAPAVVSSIPRPAILVRPRH
jgi:hypothetical protein